ncbi:hypothetical protein HDC30_002377 [Pseudomonas sp. JAI115]|uniref:DUF1173 family protein n=1 Tax=Pseudomonas sp. JAI115 TaxID=2723061 RepID=UPI00161045BD|nr:DUF1173 family protein [Pseudomonas sp. JAI115]MBB6155154.1 hypothetical protein [Pseudomonas sp. JAI115]
MSQTYPIEIAETKAVFYPKQQAEDRWEQALERAHLKTYTMCHCLSDGNECKLAIRRIRSGYVFARYQDTNHNHRRNCQFYGPSRGQSGMQGYTRKAVNVRADGGLTVSLARGLKAPKSEVENDAPPNAPRHGDRAVRRDTMRLGGLLDLLWEEASLNRWDRAKPTYWDVRVGTALLRQAEKMHVGRLTLDQALLLPAERSRQENGKTIEHQRNLDVLAFARKLNLRPIAISPLARYDRARDVRQIHQAPLAERNASYSLGSGRHMGCLS